MSSIDTNVHNIVIDPRAYNFMKATAITNITDALIELITNCDDAYQKNADTIPRPFKIDIKIDYTENDNSCGKVSVTDYACGLTAEQMHKCFTIVGMYNSDEKVRGFFSRGAKDISALGDVTFECIKDNKYSKLIVFEDSTTKFDAINEPVTSELIEKTKFSHNGTRVTIEINKTFTINEPAFYFNKFPKTLSIRNIMNSSSHQIRVTTTNHSKEPDRDEIVHYKFPNGKILLDLIYTVPRYNVKAHFVIFKYDTPYTGSLDKRFNESGFIISSGNVIHDLETFDRIFNFNPDLRYLYGTIHCDYINTLLHDFDRNKHQPLNPFPFIDPNRIGGMHRKHPFHKSLISVPISKIEEILTELDKGKNDDIITNINLNDFSKLANELDLVDFDLLDDNETVKKFIPTKKSNLIKTRDEYRKKYITVERNFMFQLRNITHTKIENDDNIDDIDNDEEHINLNDEIEVNEEQIQNLPQSVPRVLLDNGNYSVKVNDLFEQEYIPPFMLNGNYKEELDEEITDYNLYKTVSDRLSEHNVKELYVQDEVDVNNNLNTASTDWTHAKPNMLQIQFVRDDKDNYKYKIKKDGKQITIVINTGNTILKEFMNTEKSISGTTSSKAIIMLHDMLTDAFVRLLVEKDVNNGSDDMFKKLDTNEVVNTLYSMHDTKIKQIQDSIYGIIKVLLAKRKSAKQNTTN